MIYSFKSWERRRHISPEADRILPLLKSAATVGMSRKQIGNAIKLDRDVLNKLLAGLVKAGLLSITDEGGTLVYRTQHGAG